LLLRRMEARRRAEFIGAELASGLEITAPVEKAVARLHTVCTSCARGKLCCELGVGALHLGHRELCVGETTPGTVN
jgi:hypothetical protein